MIDLDPRTELPQEEWTLRSKIVAAIIEVLTDAPFKEGGETDVDVNGVYTTLFDIGGPGVLDDIRPETTPAFRVEEGEETGDDKFYSVIDETFRIYVHFKVVKAEGIDPAPMINYYFGRIGQVLVTPEHFADIAFDLREAGNSIQYQGVSDPEPGGSVFYDIDYRHGRGNRFSETGNG